MESRFGDFQEKRMFIFNELVRKYWSGDLKSAEDLDALAEGIKVKYGFDDKDIPFIKDHIRVAMGLDPNGTESFTNELDMIRGSMEIRNPVVAKIEGACEYCDDERCKCTEKHSECMEAGKYETQMYSRNRGVVVVGDKCLNCGHCVLTCNFGALADKVEFLPVADLLKDKSKPVYVTVAPAIVGQFGEGITLGQLRTAFKLLGFADMIEVALFADILTIKEAFEFNHLVKTEEDFFLTSCCCPVWFNMTKKSYPEIYKKMNILFS